MKTVYVVDACRTAIGKYGGTLSDIRPDDLLAHVIKAIMLRNPSVSPELIEEVISGAANQSGEDNRNVARMSSLLAGLPVSVAGVTVNRLCASGLQAIIDGYRMLALGEGEVVLSGGVESMTRAPFVMAKSNAPFSRQVEIYDTTIGWRFTNPALSALYYPYTMGETAENVAERWKINREDQDMFAVKSQLKYEQADENKRFAEEIIPIEVPKGKEKIVFSKDEHPRMSTLEQLAKLKPAFKTGGTVTAGNSSGVNDGAAMLMLVNEDVVKSLNLKPLARIVSCAASGVDPAIMGVGPVEACAKALKRAGLTWNDIGLLELNEAFAAQSLACIQDMKVNPEIVNVNGGAIALGHPLGCSGARISTTLLHEMQKRNVKFGIASLCIGVGQGLAVVYEKC